MVELDIILSSAQLWFLTICVVYIQHINKKSMHNNVVRLLSLIQASCSLTMTTLLPLTLKNNGLSWNAHRDITYTWSEQINLPTNLSSFLPETIYHAMKEVKCIHKVTGLNQPLRDSLHLVQMISRYNDVDVDVSVVANLKLWLWSEIWDKSQVVKSNQVNKSQPRVEIISQLWVEYLLTFITTHISSFRMNHFLVTVNRNLIFFRFEEMTWCVHGACVECSEISLKLKHFWTLKLREKLWQ